MTNGPASSSPRRRWLWLYRCVVCGGTVIAEPHEVKQARREHVIPFPGTLTLCNGTLIVLARRYRYVNDPAGPDPRLPL